MGPRCKYSTTAKESDPVRYQQKQDMIVEINRLRAENRYELYKPYYEVELNKQKLLEQEKQKQVGGSISTIRTSSLPSPSMSHDTSSSGAPTTFGAGLLSATTFTEDAQTYRHICFKISTSTYQ